MYHFDNYDFFDQHNYYVNRNIVKNLQNMVKKNVS